MSWLRSSGTSELARRRRARDLWISRSHLAAIGTGVLLIAGISFGAGFMLGETSGVEGESIPTLTAGVPDDALVELLARVEASADPNGGIRDLTFPTALAGGEVGPPTPIGQGRVPAKVLGVIGPGKAAIPVVDARPKGKFTIEVGAFFDRDDAASLRDHLVASGAKAWLGAEREGGRLRYTVSVGGFHKASTAERRIEALYELLALAPVPLEAAPAVRPF